MFERFYLTDTGANYLAKAQAGGELVFTKAVAGEGYLPDGTSITAITAMIAPVMQLALNSVNLDGNQVVVSTQFTNRNNLTPFWWSEVGLYAKIQGDAECPEALYAYANALDQEHADYIPGALTEFQFNMIAKVGNASSVTATINESLVYLSRGDVVNTLDSTDATKALSAAAGKALADNLEAHGHGLTDADITGTLPISKGGTGATSKAASLAALGAAPKESPALTGTPTAPTPTKGDNSTKVATTQYVDRGLADKLDATAYTAADVLAKIKGVDGTGSGLDADTLDGQHATAFAAASHGNHVPAPQVADDAKYLRNDNSWQQIAPDDIGAAAASHPHGAVTADGKVGSAANKAVYTGNGGAVQAGTLPVAAGGTGVATLPSGQALIGNGTGGVQGKAIDAAPTINSDNLVKSGGVYTALSGKSDVGHTHADKAPLASPVLTGTPTAPTPATTDNSTQVATTAYVRAAVAALLDNGNAVRYRGSLAGGAAIPGGDAGDLYSVSTAGSIGTHAVDAGDMLLCIMDGTAAGNSANWAVLQGSLAASALLAKLLTVDGVGSGLDADTLDGQEGSAFAAAGHGHALADSGITGTLPVSKGGTGATTAAAARTALGVTPANIGAALSTHYHAQVISITLPAEYWAGGDGYYELTLTSLGPILGPYAYIPSPDPLYHDEYVAAGIVMLTPTVDNSLTFSAKTSPMDDIPVNILQIEVF